MKRLILNISLIMALIFSLSILLNAVIYPSLKIAPWYCGSELILQKRNRLQNQPGAFNTVLIGSSRVYRQIDPAVLDSVTAGKAGTQSFNFGINWLFSPETFYVYSQLVNTEQMKFRYVVVELSKIRSVDYGNLHTFRTTYFYNKKLFIFSVRAIWDSNFSIIEKVYLTVIHTISYTDHLINLGYLTDAFAVCGNSTREEAPVTSNGFEPLSKASSKRAGAFAEENTTERNKKFLADTAAVTRRKTVSMAKFRKYESSPAMLSRYNRYYADYLNEMAAEALKRGTHLVFLLSPRLDGPQYDELIPLFHHLDPAHRVEISDARKYPELYLAGYSFDETHLNDMGAARYSAILGEELNRLSARQ